MNRYACPRCGKSLLLRLLRVVPVAQGSDGFAISCLHCGALLARTEPTSGLYRLLWGTFWRSLIMGLFILGVSIAMLLMLGARYMPGTVALFGLIRILSETFPLRPVYKLVDSGDARAPHDT